MTASHQHRAFSGGLHTGVFGIVRIQEQRHWLVKQLHNKQRALAWTGHSACAQSDPDPGSSLGPALPQQPPGTRDHQSGPTDSHMDDSPATPQALTQQAAARQEHLEMNGMGLSGSVGTGWSQQKAKADARRKKESVCQRRAARKESEKGLVHKAKPHWLVSPGLPVPMGDLAALNLLTGRSGLKCRREERPVLQSTEELQIFIT